MTHVPGADPIAIQDALACRLLLATIDEDDDQLRALVLDDPTVAAVALLGLVIELTRPLGADHLDTYVDHARAAIQDNPVDAARMLLTAAYALALAVHGSADRVRSAAQFTAWRGQLHDIDAGGTP